MFPNSRAFFQAEQNLGAGGAREFQAPHAKTDLALAHRHLFNSGDREQPLERLLVYAGWLPAKIELGVQISRVAKIQPRAVAGGVKSEQFKARRLAIQKAQA